MIRFSDPVITREYYLPKGKGEDDPEPEPEPQPEPDVTPVQPEA